LLKSYRRSCFERKATRGNQSLISNYQIWGEALKLKETRGNFFVPSPTANLVGIAKKTQRVLPFLRRDLVCPSRFFDFSTKSNRHPVFSKRKVPLARAELFAFYEVIL
jgi:hypothetical protein